MRGGNCVVDDPDGKWPCTSIFHTRDPKSIKLNSTLSQTVCGVTDEVVVERLKDTSTVYDECEIKVVCQVI